MRSAAALSLAIATLLQGCTAAFDTIRGQPRNVADEQPAWTESLQDSALEARSMQRLRGSDKHLADAAITLACANGVILMAGQVPSEAQRQSAYHIVQNIDGVRVVYSRLAVAPARSPEQPAEGAWITATIRAGMQLADVELSQRVKVVTVDKTVYLLGRVNAQTAARATRLARETRRVFRVEPLFEHAQ